MYITIQFKDKEKHFKGKEYDYLLGENVAPPTVGSIIRMHRQDGGKMSPTRVRVNGVKMFSSSADPIPIEYQVTTLDD